MNYFCVMKLFYITKLFCNETIFMIWIIKSGISNEAKSPQVYLRAFSIDYIQILVTFLICILYVLHLTSNCFYIPKFQEVPTLAKNHWAFKKVWKLRHLSKEHCPYCIEGIVSIIGRLAVATIATTYWAPPLQIAE